MAIETSRQRKQRLQDTEKALEITNAQIEAEKRKDKVNKKTLDTLISQRNEYKKIVDQIEEVDKATEKAKDKTDAHYESIKEVKDITREITQNLKDSGTATKQTAKLTSGLSSAVTQISLDEKLGTKASKKRAGIFRTMVDDMADISLNSANIGTEEFKSIDLSKALASARRINNKELIESIKYMQLQQDMHKRHHEMIVATGDAILKPFTALDSLIKKIPMGEFISKFLGIEKIGENVKSGFMDAIKKVTGAGKMAAATGGVKEGVRGNVMQGVVEGVTSTLNKISFKSLFGKKIGKEQDVSKKVMGKKGRMVTVGGKAWQRDFGKEAEEAGDEGGKKMWEKMKGWFGKIAGGFKSIVGFAFKAVMGIFLITLGAAIKMWGELEKVATDFRKETGFVVQSYSEIGKRVTAVGFGLRNIGVSTEDIWNAAKGIAMAFGTTAALTDENLEFVATTSKALGMSEDAAAGLLFSLEGITGASGQTAKNLIESTTQLADQKGVAPKAVLKDIAENAESSAAYFKAGGTNLRDAAVFAKRLGLNLGTVTKIADSMLDFESSINAQMEAEVLLGRSINLDKVRMLALTSDLEGMSREILNVVGSQAEYDEMGIIQKRALAKALGVGVDELGKMVRAEDTLARTRSGELTMTQGMAKGLSLQVAYMASLGDRAKDTMGPFEVLKAIIGSLAAFFEPTLDVLVEFGMEIQATGNGFDDLAAKAKEFGKPFADWIEKIVKGISSFLKKIQSAGVETTLEEWKLKATEIWDKITGWGKAILYAYGIIKLINLAMSPMGQGIATMTKKFLAWRAAQGIGVTGGMFPKVAPTGAKLGGTALKGLGRLAGPIAGVVAIGAGVIDAVSLMKELKKDEKDQDKPAIAKKKGQLIGTGVGAAIGGVIGSIIPGAGTVLGASLGAGIGRWVGGWNMWNKEAKKEELKRAKEQEQSIASLVKAKQEEEAQIREKLKQEKAAEQIRRETCQAFSLMRAPVEKLTQAVTKIEGKNVPKAQSSEGVRSPQAGEGEDQGPSFDRRAGTFHLTNIPRGSPHMAIDSRNIEIRLDTLNETLQDLLPQVVSEVRQGTSATNNVSRVVDDLTYRG